jgi:hypothetical protein
MTSIDQRLEKIGQKCQLFGRSYVELQMEFIIKQYRAPKTVALDYLEAVYSDPPYTGTFRQYRGEKK